MNAGPSPTVALHSLGCKVNSCETEEMTRAFEAHGFRIVGFQDVADVYVVNTCSVTNIADRKSRQMLHRARRRNPSALVVAVGCYVETDTDAVRADERIDLAIGNVDKSHVAAHVKAFLETGSVLDAPAKAGEDAVSATASDATVPDDTKDPYTFPSSAPAHRTRRFLKIQDGCDLFCSYCIIPYARGRCRSRTEDDILTEARAVAVEGIREIVLTGIHISSYGKDFAAQARTTRADVPQAGAQRTTTAHVAPDTPLSPGRASLRTGDASRDPGLNSVAQKSQGSPAALLHLLQRLHDIDGIDRIRLSSLEPRIVTPEFVDGIAALQKVCPHFHLSLQSGDNATLMRMRRHYTAGTFRDAVSLLRSAYDRPAITTDIIAGFPGETEAQFAATLSFAEEMNFYEIHVFPFSARKGTAAASMPGHLTRAVKEERAAKLLALTAEHSRAYREQFVGESVEVLWEDTEVIDGTPCLVGHTTRYVRAAFPLQEDTQTAPNDSAATGSAKGTFPAPGRITTGTAASLLTDDTLLFVP